MSFAEPASASGIDWSDYNGALLIFDVAEVVPDITTSFGPTDAVRATMDVVDGPNANEIRVDVLVFPKVLKAQLRPNVGKKVLGRLGQGQAKPAQSPPWTLTTATPADVEAAKKYLGDQAAATLTESDL